MKRCEKRRDPPKRDADFRLSPTKKAEEDVTLSRLHKITADLLEQTNQTIATAYNQAGERYEAYADGEAQELDAFEGRHAYGDQRVWTIVDQKLRGLRLAGASLRVLDLGCGPGTWLYRVVARARPRVHLD
jgi:cyclopropane fatty-acyl-phospholipid synthase-like methyltransferase